MKAHIKEKNNYDNENDKKEEIYTESAKDSISSIDSLEDFDILISNFDSNMENKKNN